MENLFDLTNTSDLPKTICEGLSIKTPNKFESDVRTLFEIAGGPLTIDEITVGYYRKYGGNINKENMMHKLYITARNKDCCFEKVRGSKSTYRLKRS